MNTVSVRRREGAPQEALQLQVANATHVAQCVRGKRRRPHGRGKPAPRRWKVQVVTYHPDLDRLLEAARDDS